MTSITIARRFNGPVASGNGGYSAGLAAKLIDGPAEATLRAAVPLGEPLHVDQSDAGLNVTHDGHLIMSLRPAAPSTPTIRPPTFAAAWRAAETYRGAEDHVLPTCFVCGPARPPGDGLRIFTDWVKPGDNPNETAIVAAPWTPAYDLADTSGRVAPEFVWAAIDCPGAFAVDKEPILLGRMTTRILERPRPGRPLVVVAWANGSERRKHFAGVALFSDTGDLLAHADQTWIQIDAHAHAKA
jgi:hypothetical protein